MKHYLKPGDYVTLHYVHAKLDGDSVPIIDDDFCSVEVRDHETGQVLEFDVATSLYYWED